MNKINLLFAMLLIVIATTLPSCEKGATGPAGANGTVNISSNIYTVTPGSWSYVPPGGYVTSVADPAITNANTDGIEVFISYNSTSWSGLPISTVVNSGDEMSYTYMNGQMIFEYGYTSAPTDTLYFKIVVISPTVMKQHPNTNWNDYDQIQSIIDAQRSN